VRRWNLVVAQVRSLVVRRRRQRELDEELRLHLEQEVAQHVARGLPPAEARRSALLAFGGLEKIKDECRDAWGLHLVDHLARDTRYATRRLSRDWRFSLLAVLILGLGIGVNTAMFSVANTIYFRQLPFSDAHQLVNIYQNDADSGQPLATSYPAYEDMAAYTSLFARLTAVSFPEPVRFYRDEIVRPGLAEYATSGYLAVLGLETSRGRWFSGAEDRLGAEGVAVLSHQAWTTKFGAAPSVIGETIRIDGVPVTVIGVGPEGHTSAFHAGVVTDFWLSIPSLLTVANRPDQLEREHSGDGFVVKARLQEGVSLPQAQAAMTALGARLADEFPDEDPGRGISVLRSDEVRMHPQLDGVLNYGASLLMTLVGLFLAIACTNLATWLLVRGLSRAKEISVRLALGATRGQLVRHLLVESSLLAVAGGAVGCLFSVWAFRVLATRLTALWGMSFNVGVGLDYRVLSFTLLLSVVTGVAFGLAPALRATRATLAPELRDETNASPASRSGFTLKNVLVVSQVTLSCVLLVWGGQALQRLAAAQTADLGFSVDRLAFIETDAAFAGYAPDEAAVLYETWRDRIAALPGVESATRAAGPPLQWQTSAELDIDGYEPADEEMTRVGSIWAGPRYFETLQIPVLHGRTFNDFDRPETPAVSVINERMARRYFGTPNAVGRRFRVGRASGATVDEPPGVGFEVIGVVADTLMSPDADAQLWPMFYRSFDQAGAPTPTVVVRTTLDPASLLPPMRQALGDLGVGLPVISARTMSQHVAESLGQARALGSVLGGLGALGLGLAGLGLYAIVAFAVSRRAREIGIRMALGARRTQVIWTVSRNVAALLAVGLTLGLGLSWLSVRASAAMSSSLSQGSVNLNEPIADGMTYVLVTVLMVAVGVVATLFPARRAAQADPLEALREL
jgi:predicted permease